MEVKTEADLTGEVVRQIRVELGLSQKIFWGRLGISQSSGCNHEASKKIPKSTRILLFAMYVVGLKIDATTEGGVEELTRLSVLQRLGDTEKVYRSLKDALGNIQSATKILKDI